MQEHRNTHHRLHTNLRAVATHHEIASTTRAALPHDSVPAVRRSASEHPEERVAHDNHRHADARSRARVNISCAVDACRRAGSAPPHTLCAPRATSNSALNSKQRQLRRLHSSMCVVVDERCACPHAVHNIGGAVIGGVRNSTVHESQRGAHRRTQRRQSPPLSRLRPRPPRRSRDLNFKRSGGVLEPRR